MLRIMHLSQTAYRKKTSCTDSFFANMESILHYTNQGDRIYMCAYDLEKAFDIWWLTGLMRHARVTATFKQRDARDVLFQPTYIFPFHVESETVTESSGSAVQSTKVLRRAHPDN